MVILSLRAQHFDASFVFLIFSIFSPAIPARQWDAVFAQAMKIGMMP
jgi:hypothetical protein